MSVTALTARRPATRRATRGAAPPWLRRLALTGNGLMVLVVVVVGWTVGEKVPSQPLLVMTYGLLLVFGAAWLLGRPGQALEVERSRLPRRVRQGRRVEVTLAVRARRRVSTVVLEESLPAEFSQAARFPIAAMGRGDELPLAYSFRPPRRGRYRIGPLALERSDPFGLTRRRLTLGEPVDVLVHPATEPVLDQVLSRAWEDPPIRPKVSKRWPTGFEFYGLRDYVAGDDPRRINWRATARSLDLETGTGRYLVRESEQGITDRVNIFLDTSREGHSPGEVSETFELGVRAAASLAVHHLGAGFAVSLHGNSTRLASSFRGRRAEIPMLDLLAEVAREPVPLRQSLARLLDDRGGHSHNVIVTGRLERDAAMRLRLALSRGVSLTIVLLLWEDTDPITVHRAARLACPVVELVTGASMGNRFRRAAGSTRR